MKFEKHFFLVLIMIILIGISAASAADDLTSDVISTNTNQELILDETINEDASTGTNDDEPILDELISHFKDFSSDIIKNNIISTIPEAKETIMPLAIVNNNMANNEIVTKAFKSFKSLWLYEKTCTLPIYVKTLKDKGIAQIIDNFFIFSPKDNLPDCILFSIPPINRYTQIVIAIT